MTFGVSLVIGASTRTSHLIPNSIAFDDSLEARTALSFMLRMPSTATRPIAGQPVYLYNSTGGAIFGGSLDNYTETCFPFTNELQLNCNCVDFTQLTGKRRVYKSYQSSGLGEYDLVATTQSFAGDGVTRTWALTYPVSTAPTITVNGFAASVAAVGAASTFGYYYTPSSFLILGNTSNNAPASTDTLAVVYSAIVGKNAWDTDIIRDINTNFFNGEGINCSSTYGFMVDGVRIPEVNFNFVPGNEAINTICEITGYSWYIDADKYMHYFPRTGNAAPFNINSTSNNWRSLTIKHSRDKYRNKEYVLGSFGTIATTESFKGDGVTKNWTLTWPVYDTPLVKINGFTATVGVLNVSASTFGYYWSKESQTITGNSTNNALASTDTITIGYTGLYPVVAVSADGEEISNRAVIEGNSGIYEEVATNKTYISTSAISYGDSILSKYGKPLQVVEFETDIDGLKAGQLIQATIPNNNIDDYFYITNVSAKDVSMATMRYHVTAVSGEDRGGWIAFFRDLVSGVNSVYTEPYTNLVQMVLTKATGNIMFTDSLTVTQVVLVIAYYDTAVYDMGTYV